MGNDLREAYRGYYENSFTKPPTDEWIDMMVKTHTPKERLAVYLEWTGIIGYTNRIYEIATGEL